MESLLLLLGGCAAVLLLTALAVRWRGVLAWLVIIGGSLSSLFRVVRGRPVLFVALAVFLIAVPTATGLFPAHVLTMPRSQREEIGAVWFVAAVIAAIASRAQDSQADKRDKTIQATMSSVVRNQMREQFAIILNPESSGIPGSYRPSVYLKVANRLHPFFPDPIASPVDPRVFEVGKGVVGVSFKEDAPYALVGEDVSGSASGLTISQQAYFRRDQIVAAVPIRRFILTGSNSASEAIGVLSVISTSNDDETYIQNNKIPVEEGMADLSSLAVRLAVASDGYLESMMQA